MRRTSLTLTALAAAACLALAGCSGSSKNASATPSAQASPTLTPSIINCAQEAGTIETDSEALPAIGGDAGAEPTVTWSEGKQAPANLVSKTLTSAEGPAVSSGDIITVNYVGWKWGSTEAFDSSFKKGAPVTFGLTGVIPGWTCGLAGHKVGERVQLSIPGKLAYGETADPARPNSPTGPLVFVVDITARITGDELTPATKDATVDSAAVKKLSDRGVTVSGDLGAPAAGLAGPQAEEPLQSEVFVIARGKGQAIKETDTVAVQMSRTSWDGTTRSSTWEDHAPSAMPAGQIRAAGLPVGSRIVLLAPGNSNGGQRQSAYIFVMDLEKVI